MARPREFDEDQALEEALLCFWDKGYEGASLTDLLGAMEITKSSFYKAFGSKEDLFRKISKLYDEDYLKFEREALAEATPRAIVERLLYGAAELQTGKRTPMGCLFVNGAISSSEDADPIRYELCKFRDALRRALYDRFEETKSAGPLPAGTNSQDAALYVASIINGMAVLAKGGATRKELQGVVRTALLSWPHRRTATSPRKFNARHAERAPPVDRRSAG
jgi:AcrR family transcriptional regulator